MYLKKLLVKINQGPNFSKAEVSKYSKCRLRDFKDFNLLLDLLMFSLTPERKLLEFSEVRL